MPVESFSPSVLTYREPSIAMVPELQMVRLDENRQGL
jgi:hypothetical protein